MTTPQPPTFDLTDSTQEAEVQRLYEDLLHLSLYELTLREIELKNQDAPIAQQLAVKLALSFNLVRTLIQPAHVDVVFAMYQEHRRLQRPDEHPLGEDFLRRKLTQLEALFKGTPHSWTLWAVDDGCPEGSGALAESILAEHPLGSQGRVLFLADAIEQGLPVAAGLANPSQSQKGGSILYGLSEAANTPREGRHLVVFTDADLSTHLGQTGLLMGPLLREGKRVAIGSRRESTSVVVKESGRNDRGKLFIYLWKRLLAPLGDIIDTQCGFKAFLAEEVREVAEGIQEKKFAFDIELLLNAELRNPGSITKVPLCWIDSDAASTTTDIQPYLPMLKSVAGMYRRYLPSNTSSDSFAAFLEELSEDQWQSLLANIPVSITQREPRDFRDWSEVNVETLKKCLDLQLAGEVETPNQLLAQQRSRA